MRKKVPKTIGIGIFVLLFAAVLFLGSCSKEHPKETGKAEEEHVYHELPISYESFRKVIGWLSDEEILVHAGEMNADTLYRFNLFSGKLTPIYEAGSIILTAAISENKQQIFIQVAGEAGGELRIINLAGEEQQKLAIETNGYLNVQWNPVEQNQLFISYYQWEEEMVVQKWDIETNQLKDIKSNSLTPIWYSENLYLYVDNTGDFLLKTGELYMGDIRNDEVTRIRNQVSGFFLSNDTFVTFSPSDFSKNELLLTRQYPFMVDKGFITVPKVSMNERLVFPYLTQSGRKEAIYGVFAKEPTQLELETGEFEFGKLNFDTRKIEPIVDVPDNAPISIAGNGRYSLYGWRFEYIIDLEQKKVYPLIPMETP
ncbi:YqgU-like beta propeller domain-containing protein [Carnobacterium antarcticum]|uniref:YqgU-like 6-bladed beta-propeller domain-containing protein n=1 Tax=Carnobacterium antarcticum TaxID=2126436 RepID=A0ABW4NQ13_9LACT|nr:hypothetical protein [Carnobacterium sp. CP1]ALV21302.1 lipoprotein [Carnobacterium sp. CP1]